MNPSLLRSARNNVPTILREENSEFHTVVKATINHSNNFPSAWQYTDNNEKEIGEGLDHHIPPGYGGFKMFQYSHWIALLWF